MAGTCKELRGSTYINKHDSNQYAINIISTMIYTHIITIVIV